MALCRCQASLAARDACNVTRASIAVIAVSGESHAPPTVAAFNAANLVNESGAPEEIRTPDPQIRSLIVSTALTFLGFP
jgi:hypothetical protein